MCCNCFGLGALNIYWIVAGAIFVLMNVTPLSTDCSASMESFMGVSHECTSLESWINYMWCFSIAGWCSTAIGLALLPKLITDCESPPRVSRARFHVCQPPDELARAARQTRRLPTRR